MEKKPELGFRGWYRTNIDDSKGRSVTITLPGSIARARPMLITPIGCTVIKTRPKGTQVSSHMPFLL